MRAKLIKHKGVIWFSILKYLEIGVTAATTFFVAKKLGPREMGFAMPIFLYITYANYLALGVNQVITKNLSRYNNKIKIRNLVTINLQILVLVSFINLILAFILLDRTLFYLVALISICIIFRGFFSSYYRAIYKIRILNKNNLIFSILLLSSVLFYVNTLQQYLLVWVTCLLLTLILYFLDAKDFFKAVFLNISFIPPRKEFLYNIKEGVKLALAGLTSTILLTSDRLIINCISIPVELKGSYQLADYFGTALYMVITTIFFYFFPKWIESLRNDITFRVKFIKTIKTSLLSIPILLLLSFLVATFIVPIIFPEYPDISILILLSIYIKLAVIFLSLISLYYIGIDQEFKYIKSLIPLFVVLITSAIVFLYLVNIDFKWIPIVLGTLIFLEAIKKIIFLKRSNGEL